MSTIHTSFWEDGLTMRLNSFSQNKNISNNFSNNEDKTINGYINFKGQN
jgi:hypothetical protein